MKDLLSTDKLVDHAGSVGRLFQFVDLRVHLSEWHSSCSVRDEFSELLVLRCWAVGLLPLGHRRALEIDASLLSAIC